ncbi:MAG: MFS transporter, partial [Acidobacteriota bacterium]
MPQATTRRGMGLFLLLWSGNVVSALGSILIGFAFSVKVYQDTGSVTRMALISLSVTLPSLLLTPWAGVVADRWDRRHILILSNLGPALLNLILYRLVQAEPLEVWRIYWVIAAVSCFKAFSLPAFAPVVALLVGRDQIGRASGLLQMGGAVIGILAPPLGGLLLLAIGLKGIVLLNFASYFAPIIILLLVRLPKPEVSAEGQAAAKGSTLQQAIYGWTFLRQRRGLLHLVLMSASITLCLSMVSTLFPPLVLGFASPVVLGLVLSATGVGTLAGGIVMAVWGGAQRRVPVILGVMAAESLILLLGGLQPNAALIASAAFCFSLGFPIMAGHGQAIWMSKVPPDVQGRVFAMRGMILGAAGPVGLLTAGPLADQVFEPLMAADGPLASTVGQLIGVGPGRGIGLFFIVLGLAILTILAVASRSRALWRLEEEVPDAAGVPVGVTRRVAEPSAALDRLGPAPALVLCLFLVLGPAWAVSRQRPPQAVGASAPLAEFSAERALAHVRTIAQKPRPVGSAAHRQVRDDLVAELEGLGLETQVQRATSTQQRGRLFQVVTVHNVVARLRGTRPTGSEGPRAVLLSAHYDSVPTSPGAGDNGAAVATLLETARALAAGPRLRNDVIFLFPDAEEVGLHGARTFVQEHPWARDVEVVVNFDARGHRGPVYMFQTGARHGWWIRRFIEGAPRPLASSLMNQIYQRLPNDTDFTAFLAAGYDGFNLAFIDGLTHYHTMLDRPPDVDPRSIQHQGSYALGLARRFGDLDFAGLDSAEREQADRAYFNLPGSTMIHYPPALAFASAVLAALWFAAVVILGLRRGLLSAFGLGLGWLAFLGMLVIIPVAITLLWYVVRDGGGVAVIMGSTQGASRYMIAFASLSLAAFAGLYRFFRRTVGMFNMAVGALSWWLILMVLTSGLYLPVASNYLFVWPLLFSLAAVGTLCRAGAETLPPWRTVGILAVAAVPGIVLVAPFTASVYVGLQSLFELGGAPLVLWIFLLGLLIPHLEVITGRRPWWLPAAAALFGVVMLGAAVWNGAETVRQNSVIYALDADTGERYWFSLDKEPDPWTRQFGFEPGATGPFLRYFPLVGQDLLRSAAPAVDLPWPELEEVARRRLTHNLQELRLQIRTAAESRVRAIWFEPAAAVVSVVMDGSTLSLRSVPEGSTPVIQRLPPATPEEELIVRIQGAEPVTVHVVDQLEGLPEVSGIEPRPE